MSVPTQIDVFKNSYSDSVHLLLEQTKSLGGIFKEHALQGEKNFFDRFGSLSYGIQTQRNQNVSAQDVDHSRRMCTTSKIFSAVHIEGMDKINMMMDPSNIYVERMGTALGRGYDDIVISALLGNAASDKDGATPVAFDITNQVIAEAASALTVAKLNAAIAKLDAAGANTTDLVLILNAGGKEDLFNDDKIINGFYNHQAYMDNKIRFRGLRLVQFNDLPDVDADTARAILVSPKALNIAVHDQVGFRIDQLQDKIDTTQILGTLQMGAVRMEEKLVVDIQYVK